jgi:pimeloyl-ACP methyl ester carboxylesterase
MSIAEGRSSTATKVAVTRPVDLKLEVVVLPVSDADRAKQFHASLGWREDADFVISEDYRVLQFTPPGSPTSKTRRLTMPVLAIGGATSYGEHVAEAMHLVAEDAQSVVIPDTGHWVAEDAPNEMLAALTAFLASYRGALAGAR